MYERQVVLKPETLVSGRSFVSANGGIGGAPPRPLGDCKERAHQAPKLFPRVVGSRRSSPAHFAKQFGMVAWSRNVGSGAGRGEVVRPTPNDLAQAAPQQVSERPSPSKGTLSVRASAWRRVPARRQTTNSWSGHDHRVLRRESVRGRAQPDNTGEQLYRSISGGYAGRRTAPTLHI